MLTHRFEELGEKPEEGRPIILELVKSEGSSWVALVPSRLCIIETGIIVSKRRIHLSRFDWYRSCVGRSRSLIC